MLDGMQKDLATIVADCVDRTTDYAEAAALVLDAVRADEALYREMVAPFERTAALALVRDAVRKTRAAVWHKATVNPDQQRARAHALANAMSETLLDFPLPGGLKIGDATKTELRAAAESYGTRAKDMAWKARWISRIEESLPDNQRVRDAFTAESLAAMQEDTK